MSYADALELFKEKRFQEIVTNASEKIALISDSSIGDDVELVKLLDISLRSALLINDAASFSKMLDRCGHLSPLSHFQAADHFFSGKLDEAWFALSSSIRFDKRYHGFWSLGLNSLVRDKNWHRFHRKFSNISYLSDTHLSCDLSKFPGKKATVVFSSDAAYFNRFFEYSVESILDKNPEFLPIYHVINPDEAAVSAMRKYQDRDVAFSVEFRNLLPSGKAYYASRRFFAAQEAIDSLAVPCFIFDIDTCINKDLTDLFGQDGWVQDKIGLKISPQTELPWQKIAAGAVYLPANDIGRKFISTVCDYLDHVYAIAGPENLWWIDQNALFFSYQEFSGANFQRWTGHKLHTYLTYPKLFDDKDAFFKARS